MQTSLKTSASVVALVNLWIRLSEVAHCLSRTLLPPWTAVLATWASRGRSIVMNARKTLLKYHVASETIASRYHGNQVRSVHNADRWDSGKKCVRAECCYRCAQCLQAPATVDSPSSVLLCVCNSLGSIETKRAQPSRLSRMVATSSVSPVPSPTDLSTQSSSCWLGHICCRALIQRSRLSENFVVNKIALRGC